MKGGETIAIFGAGPVGIMAAKSAWLRGAAQVVIVDTQQYRLDKAKQAANVETIRWEDTKLTVEQIRAMSDGRGTDVCVECEGFESDCDLLDRAKSVVNLEKGSDKVLLACMSAVRHGGTVTVPGVYSSPFDDFPVHQFFDKGIKIYGS